MELDSLEKRRRIAYLRQSLEQIPNEVRSFTSIGICEMAEEVSAVARQIEKRRRLGRSDSHLNKTNISPKKQSKY